jgi:hypothetical protein
MKYRTKQFEVEAVRYADNYDEVRAFVGFIVLKDGKGVFPGFRVDDYPAGDIVAEVYDYLHDTWVGVRAGDYIIKGMKGEFYPCDPEVFNAKYELIDESPIVLSVQKGEFVVRQDGTLTVGKLTDDSK